MSPIFFPLNRATFGSSNTKLASLALVLQTPLFKYWLACAILLSVLGSVSSVDTLVDLTFFFSGSGVLLVCLSCLRIVLLCVGLGKQWPSHEVSYFDCLDLRWLDWVLAHYIHPLVLTRCWCDVIITSYTYGRILLFYLLNRTKGSYLRYTCPFTIQSNLRTYGSINRTHTVH